MHSKQTLLDRLLARWRKPEAPQKKAATQARPFQAVSIYPGAFACAVARKAQDVRFLARDAPPLPLTNCSEPHKCRCRYLKHKDRRGEVRRAMDFAASSRSFIGQERRARRGRRSSDFNR